MARKAEMSQKKKKKNNKTHDSLITESCYLDKNLDFYYSTLDF